jgi:ubiquinone biosynthesis protein Coq4
MPIVPEAIATHEGKDQWHVMVNKELLGEGKMSLSAITIKRNMKPNVSMAISDKLY